MHSKTIIMTGMTVGSIIGGYIPVLFGAGSFSFTSLIASGIGGLAGIWLAYKIQQ